MKIYQFLYTDCIYESAFATMSLHSTKKGAYMAMRKWLIYSYTKEFDERILYGKYKADRLFNTWKFGVHQAWGVGEIELED